MNRAEVSTRPNGRFERKIVEKRARNLSSILGETISYPYILPGTIAWAGGLWLVYDGMLKKLKPVAPYQSAADIAEEYNKGIIAEITR